jgi:hypothetical protein
MRSDIDEAIAEAGELRGVPKNGQGSGIVLVADQPVAVCGSL